MPEQGPDPAAESEFEELLAEALRRRDEGEALELERLAGGRADLVQSLADALGVSSRVPQLHETLGTGAGLASQLLSERYQLLRGIGAGSMGVVYAGVDRELGRSVAVKLLRSPFQRSSRPAERMLREARSLAALRHPAILGIHDRGTTENGEPYLVLDLLDGASLADLVERAAARGGGPAGTGLLALLRDEGYDVPLGRGPVALAVEWVATVAEALAAAHQEGILHRDVKPSNVFLTRAGQIVLLDFGLARLDDGEPLTESDATLGTPAYLAPEVVAGRPEARPAQDVYGAAATLFHLLTWRAPYQGSSSRVLVSILRDDPPRAEQLHKGLPRDLQAILDKGLARDAARRYASAADLAADLRAFLQHRPVSARRLSAPVRGWRRLRRSAAARGAAVVLALGLVVGVALAWSSARDARLVAAAQEAWRPLPHHFGLGHPALRTFRDEEVRAYYAGVLDRAVDAALEPVPARLVRASFRLDHGDPRGAAADVAAIAGWDDSPYARALAAAYAALPADAHGADALDLSALPEPASPLERYLAAYHVLRLDWLADVADQLEEPALASYAPALELGLVTYASARDLVEVRRRVRVLEEQYGGPTASTTGWLAVADLQEGNHAVVVDLLEPALARWPFTHGSLVNAARAYRMLGRPEEGVELYRRALRVKPSKRARRDLVQSLLVLGDFDAAQDAAAAASGDGGQGERAEQEQLLGEVETERAVRTGDERERWRAVAEAQRHFEAAEGMLGRRLRLARREVAAGLERAASLEVAAAGQAGPLEALARAAFPLAPVVASTRVLRELGAALESDTTARGLLQLLADDPIDPARWRILGERMPPALLPATTRSLERALDALQQGLADAIR